MSNISARIVPNANNDIEMNAQVFAAAVGAFLMGDASALQARDFINAHITENFGNVLTAAEEADIVGAGTSLKTVYDGMTNANQAKYLIKLIMYSQQLQDEKITEAVWDGLMGL